MKIGLLGGSFDPIHCGHLYMAKEALKEVNLDQVWLIPAGHSPNKDENQMTSGPLRLAMCQLACQDLDTIQTCDIEVASSERSYTYRTLEKLTVAYPQDSFYYIMGADSLDYFEKWMHPEIIAKLAKLIIINRDQFTLEELEEKKKKLLDLFPAEIQILSCPKYPVSSHEIREQIKKGEAITKMQLPNKVYDYIKSHKLYT